MKVKDMALDLINRKKNHRTDGFNEAKELVISVLKRETLCFSISFRNEGEREIFWRNVLIEINNFESQALLWNK